VQKAEHNQSAQNRLEVVPVTRPDQNWWASVKGFFGEYLLPAGVLAVAMVVVLGLLAIGGLLGAVVFVPVIIVLALLGLSVLVVAEMLWRIAVLDLLLGLIGAIYAATQLVQEPIPTLVGALLGGVVAWGLHLSGDTAKVHRLSTRTLTDATGRSHRVVVLNGDSSLLPVSVGTVVGLLALLICWGLRHYGLWSLFWGTFAGLALGRALSWFSVESDAQVKVFWRPFAFLRHHPPFQQVFRWWQRARSLLGIGVAHWSND
jgi:hypothetical protein